MEHLLSCPLHTKLCTISPKPSTPDSSPSFPSHSFIISLARQCFPNSTNPLPYLPRNSQPCFCSQPSFHLECSSPESLHVCLCLTLKSPLNCILLEEAFLNQYMLNLMSNRCLDYHLKNSETESKFPIKRVM